MKTTATKKKEQKMQWYLIDASKAPLGRVASEIAQLLTGKSKIDYAPYLSNSDKVVVINSKKVVLTGTKEQNKIYRSHSGYVGNLQERTASQIRASNPNRLITDAVKGMLPKNRLRDERMANLYVYEGFEHKHKAQLGGKSNAS